MKRLKAKSLLFAAALAAAACRHGPVDLPVEPGGSARDALLDQAFSLTASDPARAAQLFEDAGDGPILETARMESWADCLVRISAPADAWRRYLAAAPPPASAARGRLHLVRALIAEGDSAGASAERLSLPDDLGPAGDEVLLTAADPDVRLAAARRLAVAAPRRLSQYDKDLDRRLLADMGPEDRLRRGRAWRREGVPARAATELRSQGWSGELEVERRREVARAEIDAGSPLGALRILPDGRDAAPPDWTLRAQAFRNRAWQQWPDRRSRKTFEDCLQETERALLAGAADETRRSALALLLECATETGRLDSAFTAWRELEKDGWEEGRREWLGRRLGIALAVRGDEDGRALEIARAVPSQTRCLIFWSALNSEFRDTELAMLGDVPVPDLYASWSLEELGRTAPIAALAADNVTTVDPPISVQRLLKAGARDAALREWRRLREARRPTPGEAFSAAQSAAQQGLANDAILWLRAGFPELGTVHLTEAPRNVAEAYLPLRWPSTLMAVAAEFDLDPWLVAGIARQESTFTAHAVSPRGAVGVMQLLPSTAKGHARALGIGSAPDLRDPELNLRLGARELAHLLQRFGALEPAIAAYNGGETRVRGWWKRQSDPRRFTEEIPIPETYNYVRRVIYLREAYRQLYSQTGGTPP